MNKATGKYITFVDGDDYLKNDYIEKMYDLAEKEKPGHGDLQWSDLCGRRWKRTGTGSFQVCISVMENEEWTFQDFCRMFSSVPERVVDEIRCPISKAVNVARICRFLCFSVRYVQRIRYRYRNAGITTYSMLLPQDIISKVWKSIPYPIRGWMHTLAKVREVGMANSPEFFELFALRIFATRPFELAPGASKVKTRELCDYIEIPQWSRYFPHYWREQQSQADRSKRTSHLARKLAVRALMILMKTRLLHAIRLADQQ